MSTILIVDDEPTARETLVAILEGENYQLELATTGANALQMLEELQPDLILLDVMMPGMDGFDVCRRIRSNPKFAEVPIILLTALDDRASLLMGIESGADDFLTKPVDRHELTARVRTITRLNRYNTLMQQRENLSEMAERLIAAQEQERQRISRELHDDMGQALTTHLLSLRNIQNEIPLSEEAMVRHLQILYDQSYEIFVKVRTLAHNLRPPVLDALGLKTAIQTYCTEFTRRTKLPIHLEIENVPVLADVCEITLYRVLQEALTNIIKHAEASEVWVDLTVEDKTVNLTIQDNGHGFIEGENTSNGIGLTGLRERMTLAGGKFNISSNPVRGTILLAQFPLLEEIIRRNEAA